MARAAAAIAAKKERPISKTMAKAKARYKRYVAAAGAMYDDEGAQVLGAELEQIAKDGQPITPAILLKRASSTSSPVHHLFEWNDQKAAASYRLHQARSHINHLLVIMRGADGKEAATKAEFSVKSLVVSDTSPRRHYVTVEEAVENGMYRKQMRDQAVKDLFAWRDRYLVFAFDDFAFIVEAIAQLEV